MALQLLTADTRIEVNDADLPGVIEPDPEVFYTVRQIVTAQRLQLQKRRSNPSTRQMEIDSDATLDAMLEYALVEWRGILTGGQPAPCVKENKLLLDQGRKIALIGIACSNRPAANREDSFREPAAVV
jgi:hypothetical protein